MFLGQNDGEVQLYYNGSEKLNTTNTGIDVTGTATMDGLTVDGDATSAGTIGVVADGGTLSTGKDSSSTRTQIAMYNPTGQVAKFDTNSDDLLLTVADNFRVYTAASERLRLDASGNLGIGTSSPTSPLTVKSSSVSATASGMSIQANGNTNNITTKLDINEIILLSVFQRDSDFAINNLEFINIFQISREVYK